MEKKDQQDTNQQDTNQHDNREHTYEEIEEALDKAIGKADYTVHGPAVWEEKMSLKDLRARSGCTIRDFAARLKMPASTYARYEKRPDHIPLRAAWRLADELGCTIDDIVGRSTDKVLFY